MGPELMANFREQAARFGTDYVTAKVSRVDLSARPFGLWVGDPDAAEPTYTGRRAHRGHRGQVADAATCPTRSACSATACPPAPPATASSSAATRSPSWAVATRPSRRPSSSPGSPTRSPLIHRRGELRASKVMQQRALDNPKIEFLWHTSVIDVLGRLQGLGRSGSATTRPARSRELAVTGLFVAIGHQPNTGSLQGPARHGGQRLPRRRSASTTYTNVEGVFACGDVQDHRYRQAITAAGSGCMAAIDAERWLEDQAASGH